MLAMVFSINIMATKKTPAGIARVRRKERKYSAGKMKDASSSTLIDQAGELRVLKYPIAFSTHSTSKSSSGTLYCRFTQSDAEGIALVPMLTCNNAPNVAVKIRK